MLEIIDISEHNVRRSAINWQAVKSAGILGVMIRIGWAGYEGGIADNNAVDDSLEDSIKGAHAVGLNVGLYVYTYTKTPQAAKIAAAECVEIAKRYPGKINLPIAFDVEETTLSCLTMQGKSGLTDTVMAFLDEVKRLGYYAVWYTYTAFAIQYLDRARLTSYDLWIADYRGDKALMQTQLGRSDYGIWQYLGDKGTCDGVTGACDRNHCYKDYPTVVAVEGLNGLASDTTGENEENDSRNYKTLYENEKAEREKLEGQLETAQVKADKFDQMMAIAQG